jgi:hypothetical protein
MLADPEAALKVRGLCQTDSTQYTAVVVHKQQRDIVPQLQFCLSSYQVNISGVSVARG